MRNILVTNALPYANGHLHLGHMLGYIQSDIWVRYQRMQNNQCYFVCGSDTHGTPVMLKAQKLGIKPEKLVEQMATAHLDDFMDFGISFDNYYSTHHELNRNLVETFYKQLKQANCITTKKIKQAYDPEKDMFLPDRYIKGQCPKCHALDQYGDSCEVCGSTYTTSDVINPISVLTGNTPVYRESTHYFFTLSKWADHLKNWIKNNPNLQPEIVNKLMEWFEAGLQDWDISRDAPYFGFQIPETKNKYFYVWLDAPIGYLASFKDLCNHLGLDFDQFWRKETSNEIYHFIGKDITYFHALFWPAILQAAGYQKPSGIFTNGFLSINGEKMSKSRGTFISARTYLNHLDAEYLKYYFASRLSSGIDDIDLNLQDFVTKVNGDLIGKVINIASRCAGFIHKHFNGRLSAQCMDNTLVEQFINAEKTIAKSYENREFAQAMRQIMALADQANQFIDFHKPWQLIKTEETKNQAHQVCSLGINLFKMLMVYLKPVLPEMVNRAELFLNTGNMEWRHIPELLLAHPINHFRPLLTRIKHQTINDIMAETQKLLNQENQQTNVNAQSTTLSELKSEISAEELAKIDLRIVKILEADYVKGADRLLRLNVDIGDTTKQVFAGIKANYTPTSLIGRYTVMVVNLKPKKMKFGLSEGMILAAEDSSGPCLLSPDENIPPGTRIN